MKHEVITPSETDRLFVDLESPSLEALSFVLRHPDTWPEGFVWDYSNCNHCAMGMARALWRITDQSMMEVTVGSSIMAKTFGMGFTDSQQIFFGANDERKYKIEKIVWGGFLGLWRQTLVELVPISRKAVTPEMVADDIDAYLARREG